MDVVTSHMKLNLLGETTLVTKKICLLILSYSILGTIGCASFDISSARKLSAIGVTTSKELVEQATSLKNEWRDSNYRIDTNRYFSNALLPNIPESEITARNPQDKDVDELIDRVNKQLAKRKRVFSELKKLYSGFDNLTQFNAAKSFSDGYINLVTEIEGYATQLVEDETERNSIVDGLKGETASIVAGGIGFLQKKSHEKNIISANSSMTTAIKSVLSLYEKDIFFLSSARRLSAKSKINLYRSLSRASLIDESKKLQEITQLAGYEPAADSLKKLSGNARLRKAVSGYTELTSTRTSELIEQAEQKSVDALKSLLSAHENISKLGNTGRLSTLINELTLLQSSIDELSDDLNLGQQNEDNGAEY